MSVKITQSTYEQLIEKDLQVLYKYMPNTLERQHIEEILKYSIQNFYPAIAEQRKPLGIQEARELVRQMLAEEISFSRFVELINEGGKK